MGGPDATPDLWKQPFSAVRASGGYPGNAQACNYLYMLGLKLNHVSKRGPTNQNPNWFTARFALVYIVIPTSSTKEMCVYPVFTRGQFWPSGIVVACVCVCVCVCLSVCLSVCQSLACPRDNSGPVQARIVKFRPKMQKTLVKVPIVFGANWPWPTRSNLT